MVTIRFILLLHQEHLQFAQLEINMAQMKFHTWLLLEEVQVEHIQIHQDKEDQVEVVQEVLEKVKLHNVLIHLHH
jgi:hypothetical protein